ncbi:MAG: hypothetical protein DI537_13645 [Stutzerimonas stutzeri]|nr:MAG: hypothetical protein DI537_13645 [Stutzerimonas stutzeri]
MQRLERIAKEHRQFYIGIANFMIAQNGASVESLLLIPSLQKLQNDSLSTAWDSRRRCQHYPFFDAAAINPLVDTLCAAILSVLESDVGQSVTNELLASAEQAMGPHRQAKRERSRKAARRDVVRTAVCIALLDATDAALNAIFADRISERARPR